MAFLAKKTEILAKKVFLAIFGQNFKNKKFKVKKVRKHSLDIRLQNLEK